MTAHRLALAFLVAVVVVATTGNAQPLDAARFVSSLYERYAGIKPGRDIVDVWVRELSKGTSPTEVHAQILGSSQTFDNARKDNGTWIRLMYREVLGREPEPSGLQHWADRLGQLKFDRVKLAREFLQSAGTELAAGGGNRPGVIPPADLPAQLKAASEALAQAVTTEFPGHESFMVRSQAGSFVKTVAVSQPILKDPQGYARQYPDTIRALIATLDAFDRGVAQSRSPAPTTRLHADQCRELLNALGQVGGVLPPPPPPILPPGGGGWLTQPELRTYREQLDRLSKDTTAAEATLRVVVAPGWATTQLLNQVDAITTEVDSLRSDLRSRYKKEDLAARVQGIQASVGAIGQSLSTGKVDVRAVQSWYSVSRSVQTIADSLSLGAPPPGGGKLPLEVFKAIDQTVAECDALLVAFSPYATYNRSVGRLTSDLTDLKNRYAALRRTVSQPVVSRRELDGHLESIDQRMKAVGTNWREATRDPRLSKAPDLIDLQSADRDLTKLIATIK